MASVSRCADRTAHHARRRANANADAFRRSNARHRAGAHASARAAASRRAERPNANPGMSVGRSRVPMPVQGAYAEAEWKAADGGRSAGRAWRVGGQDDVRVRADEGRCAACVRTRRGFGVQKRGKGKRIHRAAYLRPEWSECNGIRHQDDLYVARPGEPVPGARQNSRRARLIRLIRFSAGRHAALMQRGITIAAAYASTLNPMVVTPFSLRANTSPPCMVATAFTMARPSPWPCVSPWSWRDASTR